MKLPISIIKNHRAGSLYKDAKVSGAVYAVLKSNAQLGRLFVVSFSDRPHVCVHSKNRNKDRRLPSAGRTTTKGEKIML